MHAPLLPCVHGSVPCPGARSACCWHEALAAHIMWALDVPSVALGAALPPLLWAAVRALRTKWSFVRPDSSQRNLKAQPVLDHGAMRAP
jgi:hypothetical protein